MAPLLSPCLFLDEFALRSFFKISNCRHESSLPHGQTPAPHFRPRKEGSECHDSVVPQFLSAEGGHGFWWRQALCSTATPRPGYVSAGRLSGASNTVASPPCHENLANKSIPCLQLLSPVCRFYLQNLQQ